MYFLDKEDIYLIHSEAIKDFGGNPYYYSNTDDKIESILSQQYGYFRYDKYPTIFDKAAMLMYFFVKDHCFFDGNKRVGFDCAIVLLTLNGYDDNINGLDGYYKTMEIAKSQLKGKDIDKYILHLSEWLQERFK